MAGRLKITLIFTMIMFLILSSVCGLIYYYCYQNRLENIRTHLTNRAMTTASMLNQSKVFDQNLMLTIDSRVVRSMKNKSIQVYDHNNEKIYNYSDVPADTIKINTDILNNARIENIFFIDGIKEAIAFNDNIRNDNRVILVSAFDEEGKRNLRRIKLVLWLSFIGGILITFASGYFFSRILLRPIRKIADQINIISAQSLEHRIKSGNRNDDWHYLTDTLNDLLNRLQESFEIQRRFISSVSHELSTPLTSISSQLEVSLQRDRAAEEYRQVMQSVYQDVRHLIKLTQILLEFATAAGTAGGIDIKLIRIDEVLMRLTAEMKKIDKGCSVKLEFDELPADEEKLLVFGNAELLFAAIKNIVSNACKYSLNRLAKVKLSVVRTEIIVAVEDNGKGISENDLKNIFQPFYRTEDSRATVGFGVGLPLVNRIIKLHKGQIKVISNVGKGTTFFVHLPVAGKTTKT